MKKTKFLPALLILITLFAMLAPTASAIDEPQINSETALLMDMDSGRELYSKNADARVEPASLTKIMTALLAIEAIDSGKASLADNVTASANILADMVEEGSTSNIVPGEAMTLANLLYCIMLESANEGCNVIAEHIGGSMTAFVNKMNERATALGCLDTHFDNAHGLPSENHYTTARDMYLITREAMKKELFREICNTQKYIVPATNVAKERELQNTNGLINPNSKYYPGYHYEYAAGVKTGHTEKAGYCLISTAAKENINVIAVVMGGQARPKGDGSFSFDCFTDSRTLYDWAFSNFSQLEILSSAELVSELDVELAADNEKAILRPKQVMTALLPNDTDISTLERKITYYHIESGKPLKAPIAAGAELGTISVLQNGVILNTCPLVANATVELSKKAFIREQLDTMLNLVWVKIIFWVLILALLGYFFLVIRYRILHKRHLESVKKARMQKEMKRRNEELTRIFEAEGGPLKAPSLNKMQNPNENTGRISRGRPPETGREGRNPIVTDRDFFEEFFLSDTDDKNN
ncbi:MAG: D-alanyl-D-alanine carboxypeptidase [Ruminococcaceae bacterium]|nr:D-alanyl-D-alanine carboxypeptidase [Oscillospiraceae bacterium]